jgi:hypothetical protein
MPTKISFYANWIFGQMLGPLVAEFFKNYHTDFIFLNKLNCKHPKNGTYKSYQKSKCLFS